MDNDFAVFKVEYDPTTNNVRFNQTGNIPAPLLLMALELKKSEIVMGQLQASMMQAQQQAAQKIEVAQAIPPASPFAKPGKRQF